VALLVSMAFSKSLNSDRLLSEALTSQSLFPAVSVRKEIWFGLDISF
jgi:hypothetical protein